MKIKIICVTLFILLTTTLSPITSSMFDNKQKFNDLKISSDNGDSYNKAIRKLMERGHFPSVSVCIVEGDEVIWSQGFGYSDMENKIPATEKTIYQIASVTKTVTGTALLQLYDSGYFDLDDDINDFLPFELKNPNFPGHEITFRMLLSHSSSLRNTDGYWNIDFVKEGPPFDGYPMPWLEDYLTETGSLYEPTLWDKESPPGDKSSYANINFDIIAFLVELISEEPFYDYCKNHIFEPLDMQTTSFRLTDFYNAQVAIPYYWNPYSKTHEKSQNWVYIHYPAGGLFTTVTDLSHFLIAHMNDGVYNNTRILNQSTIEEMHNIQPPGNKNSFYFGMAWLILTRTMWLGFEYPLFTILSFKNTLYSGHGGDISYGLHTRMNMRISDKVGVIFFINTHRIHRTGWNCAELLNELFFLRTLRFFRNEKIFSLSDFIYEKSSNDSLRFEIISNKIIINSFFINQLDKSKNMYPFFKIMGLL